MTSEYSPEFLSIFQCAKDKRYIDANAAYLRSFFEKEANINMLKHSLTTKHNMIALRLIERLRIRVIPYLHISQYTYFSSYWLFKKGMIGAADFKAMQKKFEGIRNYAEMFKDAEHQYIEMQMESDRRRAKTKKTYQSRTDIEQLGFKMQLNAVVFVDMDEILNCEEVVRKTPLQEYMAEMPDIKQATFKMMDEDSPQTRYEKSSIFWRYIRILNRVGPLDAALFLDKEASSRLFRVGRAMNKLKARDMPFFLCTRGSLKALVGVMYMFLPVMRIRHAACMSLHKSMETKKRKLLFGPEHIPMNLMELTIENLTKNYGLAAKVKNEIVEDAEKSHALDEREKVEMEATGTVACEQQNNE